MKEIYILVETGILDGRLQWCENLGAFSNEDDAFKAMKAIDASDKYSNEPKLDTFVEGIRQRILIVEDYDKNTFRINLKVQKVEMKLFIRNAYGFFNEGGNKYEETN